MELVPGFLQLLQPLASTMTAPTFDSMITVLTGRIFAGRRTVTRMILADGSSAGKHYSSYHRVFSTARWSLDAVGLAVFDLIQPFGSVGPSQGFSQVVIWLAVMLVCRCTTMGCGGFGFVELGGLSR